MYVCVLFSHPSHSDYFVGNCDHIIAFNVSSFVGWTFDTGHIPGIFLQMKF